MAEVNEPGVLLAARKADVVDALRACCQDAIHGAIVPIDFTGSGAAVRGRFAAVLRDFFTFELPSGGPERVFQPFEVCCVTYRREARAFVFLSQFRDLDARSQTTQITMTLPLAIAGVEGRTCFRVPVFSNTTLQVRLRTRALEGSRTVRARDISVAGMRVQIDSAELKLQEGTTVKVELQLGREVATVAAIVRRCDRNSLGLYFNEVLQKGRLEPPERLVGIVNELEAMWIRGRVR